jgi:hypothetical protein
VTTWAHVIDNSLVSVGPFPGDLDSLVSTDDDGIVTPVVLTDAEKIALEQQAGYFRITDTPRPNDTPSTTWVRSVENVAGVWTVRWAEVAKSAEQIAAEVAGANEQAMRSALQQSLADLRLISDSTGTLTAAQMSNALRVLSRAQSRMIRVALRVLNESE